jgi:tetratricopeptide (TPR) repeat protein
MRLQPTDRYPSAHSLSEDIRRWMADEPVSVHNDSIMTCTLRWARHHKPLVAGTGALVATALVTLTAATVLVRAQRNEARHARDEKAAALKQAEDARTLAEHHAHNGTQLINELVTLGDRQLISSHVPVERRRQLLESALHFIRATREGRAHNPNLQAETALIARRLAHLYGLVGDFDRAEPLFSESVATFQQLVDRDPRSVRFRNLLAETLIDQAECRKNCGRMLAAREAVLQGLDLARNNGVGDVQSRTLGRALYRSSEILRKLGENPQPDPSVEAAQLLKPLADASLGTALLDVERGRIQGLTDQLEYVSSLVLEAEAHSSQGQPGEAESELRRAVDRTDKLHHVFERLAVPDLAYFHAWAGQSLASFLIDAPEHRDEALRLLDHAIQRLTHLTEDSPDYVHFQATLAQSLVLRSRLHQIVDRWEAAETDVAQARTLLEGLLQSQPKVGDFASLLGVVEEIAGTIARHADRSEEAREHFREALRLQGLALKANPNDPVYQRRKDGHLVALEALNRPK